MSCEGLKMSMMSMVFWMLGGMSRRVLYVFCPRILLVVGFMGVML